MGKIRIAVPTKSHEGLQASVSKVFGKAETFTIVDVEDGKIKEVQVIDNPAASYEYGAGPVAVKTLADHKVNLVVTGQLGPGASNLLKHYDIRQSSVEHSTRVSECVKEALSRLEANKS